jgi:hypothetical protein
VITMDHLEKSAWLSTGLRYRYHLTREWGDGERVVFIMLNPSTADTRALARPLSPSSRPSLLCAPRAARRAATAGGQWES